MAVDLYLPPDFADDALAIDQEGGPLDAHIFLPVHALLDPNAVVLGDLAIIIRGERKGELEFLLELVVACDRVARDAHDLCLHLGEVGEGVSKGAGLGGTAWRVVARIEIKHDGLALELLERNRAAAIGGQGEVRCLVAYLKAHLLSS